MLRSSRKEGLRRWRFSHTVACGRTTLIGSPCASIFTMLREWPVFWPVSAFHLDRMLREALHLSQFAPHWRAVA